MITNRQLILPYAAPYLAYVGIASIPEDILPMEISYPLRLIAIPLLLAWGWRWYCPITGPRSTLGSIAIGMAAGVLGLVVWIALLAPFTSPGDSQPWSISAFIFRLLSAGLVVPLFEELMMRGFVFRLALQWDDLRKKGVDAPLHRALDEHSVNTVAPGAWSWAAVLISTLAFTSGHAAQEWPAAVAYGLLMALLWIMRRDLLTCIIAHAVTNITLAWFVFATGSWQYW
ncbi:MAG: CPBP family glutamic-type intramembrane protease [Desulfobulbus sp.]|nr:CPBP family glutamic-type intramembrane protease [Desulfobulbus sp.]